jgi:VIT1/CCC1 family predicted Fe2+/Mn2+ transporter
MVSNDLQEIAKNECVDEITDSVVYKRLASLERNPKSRDVFIRFSQMEQTHYEFWRRYLDGVKIKPSRWKVYLVVFVRFIFGAAFALKYLEGKEAETIRKYEKIDPQIPQEDKESFNQMLLDEKEHERIFAEEVQGGYVKYISFVVLGLADALVEIAGIHAGSLGIYKSTELTGLAGIVAGAAASLAMASAAYAQAKQGFQGSPGMAAAYTGGSYFVSAVILASPYFVTKQMLIAISTSLVLGVGIIAFTTWYNSVISGSRFLKDFGELAGIMLGATVVLYIFGTIIRTFLGITV